MRLPTPAAGRTAMAGPASRTEGVDGDLAHVVGHDEVLGAPVDPNVSVTVTSPSWAEDAGTIAHAPAPTERDREQGTREPPDDARGAHPHAVSPASPQPVNRGAAATGAAAGAPGAAAQLAPLAS